ncbi:MAG: TonB-dependent receptor [Muribaculaceae bacterium]|nr:TonB-dependent receptor [Muribaculaceae bacterium]
MIRALLISAFLLACLTAVAQADLRGTVMEKGSGEALPGASVILRDAQGKIKKYATADAKGAFAIPWPGGEGYTLDVAMMGFAKQTIKLDGKSKALVVEMEPATTLLKEVAVKADRIREQGDTISYSVGSFAQEQDRTIGDVLKRMPGIDVARDGKIQYQGSDINKFYIEGSDLLGGRYGIATNGIKHDDVGAVEVMENHQPMQVLSGISFSDKAAINLKLKEKAKATWSVHGDAGGGYSAQPAGALWDGEVFAMAVMPGFQNISTLKSNNTGENLSAQATDFFASRRGTGLSRYVSVDLPGVPSLKEKRTLFNRSVLASTNSLWKVRGGEFKAQIDYAFNRVAARAAATTTYFLENGDRIVAEERDGCDRTHSVAAKFIYEVNQKTTFINNTLQANVDFDNVRLDMVGSLPNVQRASLPDYYVSNKFRMIKRFGGKHLVTFNSTNEWESLPQSLAVTLAGRSMSQTIGDHAFHTSESAEYTFTVKGVTISLEAGVKGYVRAMHSELAGLADNSMSTNYFTVFATPTLEYWLKRVNLKLDVPVSFARYTFGNALRSHSDGYFSPSLSMNWKPSNRFTMTLRGTIGRSPMDLNLIQPGYIMTDYRSFRRGVDKFYRSGSQSVSGSLAYKHTRRGLFANAFIIHSWSDRPYTQAQQLYGDYIATYYTDAKSTGRSLMARANLGKTLDFIRGSAGINASFSRSRAHLISEERAVNSVSTNWSVGAKINGNPVRWFSFDYEIYFDNSRLSMNGTGNAWLSGLENTLLLNFMPHPKWECRISGEHYRNELTEGAYKNAVLLDAKVVYKLNKRIELSATLSNIFDRRSYNYTSYSQLSSFESQRRLRGREILVSISLRK